MTSITDPSRIMGATVVDRSGGKIGKVGQVYLDDQTGQPTWVTVNTGLFGTRESFAPLQGAQESGDGLTLAVEKDTVKNAPNVSDDGHIGDDEQRALYEYYAGYLGTGPQSTTDYVDESALRDTGTTGVAAAGAGAEAGTAASQGYAETGGPGHDTSGPNTDDAMTRSEEQLHVGTQQVEAGRARLRKYVVTENVTQTVPVSHEEVRIEREPITDANVGAATDGPAISEEEHEVTLHAEQPVVQKEAVPVERVRVGTETVTEQQTVNEQVRKEQIDVDGDTSTTGGTSAV
jgi:uncharacterized protein (TIGR02271 family)